MPGGIDLKNDVLNSSLCTLCGACLDWCPYLKNIEDKLVMTFDCNAENGRCYSVCPRTCTDWQEINNKFLPGVPGSKELGSFQKVFKVRSSNSFSGQQDGGTVSSLLKAALEDNVVQAAVLTGSDDNITPESFIGRDVGDIQRAAGSRFLASPGMREIINAEQKGIEKMVVVGRPCQVQALRKWQYNRKNNAITDVLSIGLFCMWSLSWNFKDYLNRELSDINIEKIAIPRHGVEIVGQGETRKLSVDKVKEFVRKGCNYCLDMTSELADLSVGAFEGESGWNTVMVRTPEGESLLNRAKDKGYLVIEEHPDDELERLKQASLNKKLRGLSALKEGVDSGGLKSHIDLSKPEYQEILKDAEGMVNS